MTAEIRFDEPFPEDSRAPLLRMIGECAWLLPSWVEVLNVSFEQAAENVSMRMRVREEYRSARLSVCAEWLRSGERIRLSDIRHEFFHVTLDPLHRVAVQLLDLIDDDRLRKWAAEEVRLAGERVACDLEHALNRGPF